MLIEFDPLEDVEVSESAIQGPGAWAGRGRRAAPGSSCWRSRAPPPTVWLRRRKCNTQPPTSPLALALALSQTQPQRCGAPRRHWASARPEQQHQQQQQRRLVAAASAADDEVADVAEPTETRVVVITSGKGGVGKTTSTANLGMSIAR